MMRSNLASRKFHAMVGELATRVILAPHCPATAREAVKRYLIAMYVLEARWEAYGVGRGDPFPVRPVPSRSLASQHMDELIEFTYWLAVDRLGLILE